MRDWTITVAMVDSNGLPTAALQVADGNGVVNFPLEPAALWLLADELIAAADEMETLRDAFSGVN